MTDQHPDDAPDRAFLDAADARYRDGVWSAAAMLFRAIIQRNRALALDHGVPLALGHCLIELQDDVDITALARDLVADVPMAARPGRIGWMRIRALDLCRAGELGRAQRLLRFLATFDVGLAVVYRHSVVQGRTGCWEQYLAGDAAEPAFLRENQWSDDSIAALKRRFRGRKILMILSWMFPFGPGDRYRRSADAFGLSARTLDRADLCADADPSRIAARLQQHIEDFGPDIVLIESFAEMSGYQRWQSVAEAVDGVLAAARARGVRVVANFNDAWMVEPAHILGGLGAAVDLIHHCHPQLMEHPALNDPRLYCYFHPVVIATPTVPAGSIARAGSFGSVNFANVDRVLWWAEAGTSGLPIDFTETAFDGERRVSAEQYSNLLCQHQVTVNLTQRATGVRIITGRTLETLLAGGVLVEQESFDTRYFLKPGVHYLPFETLDDLRELIPWLLGNPDYRARLARDGQRWVQKYFTGDWFWAGLLHRLYPDSARA